MRLLLRGAALGFALGAVWGVLARIWMRLVTTEPEFTWGGTLSIIVLSAVLGTGVGVVHAARRTGRSSWWTLAIAPGLLLFLSPGMVLAPCFGLGGLAWGARGRDVQVIGGLAVAGSIALAVWAELGEMGVVYVVGYVALACSLAWASSLVWQRPDPSAVAERRALRADGGVVTVTRVDDRGVGQGEQT